jgi:long-chain acyl-CoA synthetase
MTQFDIASHPLAKMPRSSAGTDTSRPPFPKKAVETPEWLDRGTIRRLIKSLIHVEHERLASAGRIDPCFATRLAAPYITAQDIEALAIDEATLGFDSLSLIDLVLAVNRLFGLHTTGVEDYLMVQRTIGDWTGLVHHHLSLRGPDANFTFMTSGSSGAPREITHSARYLTTEIRAFLMGPMEGFSTVSDVRILALVPAHHIYGFLFTCLLPKIAGFEVLDLCRAGPNAASRLAKAGDIVVGTPFTWQILEKTRSALAPGVCGVTSGAPSTQQTWDGAKALGLDRMIEIYGATETSGIGTRRSFDAPFDLLPHLKMSQDEIYLHEDTPGGVTNSVADGRPLPLQDNLVWQGKHKFAVAGRKDDMVQIGGVNVSPQHVREVLLAAGGVADAAVRLDLDRLKAFVVPAPRQPPEDDQTLQARLREVLRSKLPAPARPQNIRIGDEIPKNSIGKLTDWDV